MVAIVTPAEKCEPAGSGEVCRFCSLLTGNPEICDTLAAAGNRHRRKEQEPPTFRLSHLRPGIVVLHRLDHRIADPAVVQGNDRLW
jgi:hypothetical protein